MPGDAAYLGSPGGVTVNCFAYTAARGAVTMNTVFMMAVPFMNLVVQ